jgi:hypothetical protein
MRDIRKLTLAFWILCSRKTSSVQNIWTTPVIVIIQPIAWGILDLQLIPAKNIVVTYYSKWKNFQLLKP